MAKQTGGFRARTRHKLRKKPRQRGKISIRNLLQSFKIGEKVTIAQEPAIHKGMPHPKYKNVIGRVVRQQGRAYVIEIHDGGKRKEILALPVHIAKKE